MPATPGDGQAASDAQTSTMPFPVATEVSGAPCAVLHIEAPAQTGQRACWPLFLQHLTHVVCCLLQLELSVSALTTPSFCVTGACQDPALAHPVAGCELTFLGTCDHLGRHSF